MSFSLKDKSILITGASSGIGRAVAQQCATASASCIITARNEDRLKQTLDSLSGNNNQLLIADLCENDAIVKLVELLPKLDGVVLCAGIFEPKMLKFTDDHDMIKLFETNVYSVIRIMRELVQQKKLKKEASIVIISSVNGVYCGSIGGTLYGATKGALEGFVKSAALELAPLKIRVNTILPGMVETPILRNSEIDNDTLEADKQNYPLKRYGRPEEIGQASVYLLSDSTKWMTGSSIKIDGGYTL